MKMVLKQKISTLVSVRFLKCLSIHSLIVPIDNFYNISLNENGFKQKISTLVSGAFLKCLSILSLIVPINNFFDISLKLQYTICHNALIRLMLLSLSSNIPAAPAYGDYAVMKEPVPSIRTLLSAGKVLTTWLLSQGRGIKVQTGDNAEKVLYYVWHQDLVIPYNTWQFHF